MSLFSHLDYSWTGKTWMHNGCKVVVRESLEGNLRVNDLRYANNNHRLRDFTKFYAKLFDGCRHDSGDPMVWGEKLIGHYKSLGIDPMTKMAVFSDGLTIPRCIEILKHFRGRIGVSFGVGTNLTCDIEGITPINIVIKMVKANGQDVAKISDSPGKNVCGNPVYVAYLKQAFGI